MFDATSTTRWSTNVVRVTIMSPVKPNFLFEYNVVVHHGQACLAHMGKPACDL